MSPLHERQSAPRSDSAATERQWPRWWPLVPAALVALLALWLVSHGPVSPPSSTTSGALSAEQKSAVEATVRDYILAHPEIIPQAITALQNRSVAHLVATNRAEIETPFAGAWTGAKNGDVTLVEFFDFACPICLQESAELDRLAAADHRVRIVYRDFPVVTAGSAEPALAALAAARQGRYHAFYAAMFSDRARLSHEKVVANVRAAHLDEVQVAHALAARTDVDELKKNIELGRALGLTGTPGFVIGDRVFTGALTFAELRRAVADARAGEGRATG